MGSFDIPKEQWAQVNTEFGKPAVLKKIPVAKPGPDEILVNVKYSGVCHSDVHAQQGDWPTKPSKMPFVGGHEGVGVVVAKGDAVTEFEIGDYAGIKWINGVCTKCNYCTNGQEMLCPDARISGYTVDGSFQQYCIAKAPFQAKIPKDCDLSTIAPVMCAGITMYKGLKTSEARPGQYVAIVGAGGGLGVYGLQYAKAMGFIPIAVDSGAEKGRACMELGAVAYVDIETSKDIFGDLKKATADGLGPHAALISSSENAPFERASEYVRPLGTVVVVGIPTDGGFVKSQVFDMCLRVITIKGTLVGNSADMREAIEFARRGLINVPQKLVPLSTLQQELDLLQKDKVVGRYVVDNSK